MRSFSRNSWAMCALPRVRGSQCRHCSCWSSSQHFEVRFRGHYTSEKKDVRGEARKKQYRRNVRIAEANSLNRPYRIPTAVNTFTLFGSMERAVSYALIEMGKKAYIPPYLSAPPRDDSIAETIVLIKVQRDESRKRIPVQKRASKFFGSSWRARVKSDTARL